MPSVEWDPITDLLIRDIGDKTRERESRLKNEELPPAPQAPVVVETPPPQAQTSAQ